MTSLAAKRAEARKPQGPAPLQTIVVDALDARVQTEVQLEQKYGDNVDDLCNDHEQLIEQILEEEEHLIHSHRTHIDEVVGIVKEEMTLLNEVDKPGSDVEVYAKGLDKILLKKIQIISEIRERLLNFYSHLKTEEHMSKLYERNQEMANEGTGGMDQDVDTQITYDQSSSAHRQQESATRGNLVDDILNGALDGNM